MAYFAFIATIVVTLSMIGHLTMSDGMRLFRAMHRRVVGHEFRPRSQPRHPLLLDLFIAAVSPLFGAYACSLVWERKRPVASFALVVTTGMMRIGDLTPLEGLIIMQEIAGWAGLNIRVTMSFYVPGDEESDIVDDDEE